MKYVIITPVKNEETYINSLIDSVINQTQLPEKWLIVDDKSTDSTLKSIKEKTKGIAWIMVISNSDVDIFEKGARIAAIINHYAGYFEEEYDILCKIDADVKFDKDFFISALKYFEENEKLGIASGTLIYKNEIEENIIPSFTRGATKLYRKSCFISIGGVYETTGWDTIDNVAAQEKEWLTQTLPLYFEHLKEEGRSQGFVKKYFDSGLYYGKIPYYFPYLSLKLIYRIFDKPPFISSLLILAGYLKMRFFIKEKPFPQKVSKYFVTYQKRFIRTKLGL